MSSPVSSQWEASVFGDAVQGGVVGGVVLPAAPDDAQPGAGEDAGGVGVGLALCAVVLVDGLGPGAGVAAVGGEVDDRLAQLLVAGPAEADLGVAAGLAGRGRGAGERGQAVGGGEAAAGVADLDQELGGADAAGSGQGLEDLPVGVQRELIGELCVEGGDLGADGTQGVDVGQGGVRGGVAVLAGQSGCGCGEAVVQHPGGGAAAVALGGQPGAQPAVGEPRGGGGRGEAGQEGQADRRVQGGEQPDRGGGDPAQVGAELVARRHAGGDQVGARADHSAQRQGLWRVGEQRGQAVAGGAQR